MNLLGCWIHNTPIVSEAGVSTQEWLIWVPSVTPAQDGLKRPIRRGITTGGRAVSVTLSYGDGFHRIQNLRHWGTSRRSAGPARGFGEPYRNPTTPRRGA
jgi:hypothetical protein